MTLTLKRTEFREDGIFGILTDENGKQLAVTLEHAYESSEGGWEMPKIPEGTYTCRRGQHRLEGMTEDFTTFEITNVPGHTNILFHFGNWNDDSQGCILLGEALAESQRGQMITNSRVTFQKFMDAMNGLTTFSLEICN